LIGNLQQVHRYLHDDEIRTVAQSSPSPTAIDDWVRARVRIVPWRRPAQLRQLQFHCGKPPPAAEPSTCTRIAAWSLLVGAAILAKTPRRRPGRVPNVPARRRKLGVPLVRGHGYRESGEDRVIAPFRPLTT
jgi:hypothetical protein